MTENSPAEAPEAPEAPEDREWLPSEPYSWPQLNHRLAEIVASKPKGYRYNKQQPTGVCSYWHKANDTPDCLLGQLLFNLGVPSTLLRVCDLSPKGGTIGNVASY